MLLAIDVGNTNTLFALIRDGAILHRWRIATAPARTADEYMVWLSQLMALEGFDRRAVTQVIISTVVPATLFNLGLLCRPYFAIDALIVTKDLNLGMPIDYPNPAEVGADRLVNAVAATAEYGRNLVIIDFGTATTFDVVDSDGAYIGGAIAPGVNLSLEALHMAAAALPHVDITKPTQTIGTNTVACMQAGIYWGYVGLVEGIVRQIRAERGRAMKVIGTGGLASLFDQGTEVFDGIEDDLTMHGLVLIQRHNKELGTA